MRTETTPSAATLANIERSKRWNALQSAFWWETGDNWHDVSPHTRSVVSNKLDALIEASTPGDLRSLARMACQR